MTPDEKVANFLEQQLITDVPLACVRAARRLMPDRRAAAGRLLAGIEKAALRDAHSSLATVDEYRRLWAVDEAAARLA